MDVHMPRMGGLEAVRNIRNDPRWTGLPVIALTAQARGEDHQASLDAGMSAHLSKPIDEMALYRTLAALILGANGQFAAATPAAPDPAADTLRADVAQAMQQLGRGRPDRLRLLLGGFLRDYEDAGRRAAAWLAEGRIDAIAELAHAIKGSASYLRATALCETAEELEVGSRRGDQALAQKLVPVFASQLDDLLEAVREGLLGLPLTPPPPKPVTDPQVVLRLIDEAMPLVARGDFAAQAWLQRIASAGLNAAEFALAEQAAARFDDLELGQAEAALLALRGQLEAEAREEGGSP